MTDGLLTPQAFEWQWGGSDFYWRSISPLCPAAAAFIDTQNLPRHARIGLCCENSPEAYALIQAAALTGHCLVLLNPRLEQSHLENVINNTALDLLIGDISNQSDVKTIPIPEFNTDTGYEFNTERSLDLDDPCVVVMSSGSGGNDKFIRLSLRAILTASSNAIHALNLREDDCWLACLPFYHVGGLSIIYRSAMSGSNCYICPTFDEQQVNDIIDTQPISGASLVPTMLHRLLERENDWPQTLRCLLIGGAAKNFDDFQRSSEKGLCPIHSYGMSETCGFIAVQTNKQAGDAHCGNVVNDMSVRHDEQGILHISGPQLFSGYEDNGQLEYEQKADGFYTTQDIGYLDEIGCLYINGRSDDIFIRGGENISLIDVESHISGLQLCGDFALCILKDQEWGQVPGLIYTSDIDEEELLARFELLLHALLRPAVCKKVNSVPLLANGKIDRQAVASYFN